MHARSTLFAASVLVVLAAMTPSACSYGVDSYTLTKPPASENPECTAVLDSGVSFDAAVLAADAGTIDPSLLDCFASGPAGASGGGGASGNGGASGASGDLGGAAGAGFGGATGLGGATGIGGATGLGGAGLGGATGLGGAG